MIFITVGTDLPFDRMVRVIDRWAGENERTDVFAQIGEGGWKPEHIEFAEFLQPPDFMQRFVAADIIISHAGMGTILSALRYGKPILVMPKRAHLGEHRNEHQLATAEKMRELGNVNVAFDEDELVACLDKVDELVAREPISPYANPELIAGLSEFIHQKSAGGTR
ncbi:MAG: glycosyltransferase [Verrucomicrobiales bacterium]|nr:glycosyltransferase [Verrucomicrobiota bacterium JB025]